MTVFQLHGVYFEYELFVVHCIRLMRTFHLKVGGNVRLGEFCCCVCGPVMDKQ